MANNQLVDMVGFVCNKLTVVKRDTERKSRDGAYWLCQCSCNNPELISVRGSDLRAKRRKSCGKCNQFEMIGKTYGRLTVLEVALDYNKERGLVTNHIYYKCQCSCENQTIVYVDGAKLRDGHTQSCGCYGKEKAIESRAKDLTGQVFGRLTAIKPVSGQGEKRQWLCRCSCSEQTECLVITNNLISGHTQSCGCLGKERIGEISRKDLSGQVFGFLTALEPTNERNNNCVVWKCRCSRDGNICYVSSSRLIAGITQSCGCLQSTGEANIQRLLQENNITFEYQKSFSDFRTDKSALYRYDFYLPEYNRLIEFDGIQHYKNNEFFGGQEEFDQRQLVDKVKNEYALSHNIELVRIPYWMRDNITLDILLGDKYLIKEV